MEIKKVVFDERWFRIKKDDGGYVFYAYPRRNKNQPVGNSRAYDTKEECYTGIENFIKSIIDNKIDSFNSKFIEIEERERKLGGYKYRYVCKDLQGEDVFYGRFVSKQNAQKGVVELYKRTKYILSL